MTLSCVSSTPHGDQDHNGRHVDASSARLVLFRYSPTIKFAPGEVVSDRLALPVGRLFRLKRPVALKSRRLLWVVRSATLAMK